MMRTRVIKSLYTQVRTAKFTKIFGPLQKFRYATHLGALDTFQKRHVIQPDSPQVQTMLRTVGVSSLDELVAKIVPSSIHLKQEMSLDDEHLTERGEQETLQELKQYASMNQMKKSLIGMGFYNTITPNVILRNVLENPGWYTPYTPYQAEISQGRLEALLNFQTMICELTALPIANASLLDEATACGEAMHTAARRLKEKRPFFVSSDVHPQNIAVMQTRAKNIGVEIIVGDVETFDFEKTKVCGALIQYPGTYGKIRDYKDLVDKVHKTGGLVVAATDLLALTVLKAPGEFGVDIAVGTNQRFGIPVGYGGPNAGFLACTEDMKRGIPGRIIGVSKDVHGNKALRMALQTREQHIRREKATSNICTAQALLANMSGFYAIYHGPDGLKKIGTTVHEKTVILAKGLAKLGYKVPDWVYFDTLQIGVKTSADEIMKIATENGYNFRKIDDKTIGISLDETITGKDLKNLFKIFNEGKEPSFTVEQLAAEDNNIIAKSGFARTSKYLQQEVFNKYKTEHEMLRYLHRLESKDIGMNVSMIPLGSCTMKLNATSEMIPITWPEFTSIHPYVPVEQAAGYHKMFKDLENWLCKITGLDACSLQPNSGAQGEFTGLNVIRAYLTSIGQGHRDICLIPSSAHGTNPASAAITGMKIVVVGCDKKGNVDIADLKSKVQKHGDKVAALMITYPSTHGVFESGIKEIIDIVHNCGGQVYMDGANMNAQVGLTSPGTIGADVCHLNLHKTFCIPHGGGGPGMGPICVAKHLAPFLPGSPVVPNVGGEKSIGAVASAPFGSANILPITWMYIRLMGSKGLKKATQMAILNANYMAKRLSDHYPIVYTGENGFNAHEFILDLRHFKKTCGVEAEDVAKRLMDYGYHAPTMSFPIPNTLMIEPTESESKEELDRFCDALIMIREEIRQIEQGKMDKVNNPLKNAPHTQLSVMSDKWDKPYSRELAAFPAPWTKEHKVWPTVGRIDGAYGDRNLICTCPPTESYQ